MFVDEYQDTDPAQVRLLQVVAGEGRNLVVVGDPDQSVYAFRGAEVRGILEFADRFRTAAGAPAPVLALGETRRFGQALLAASRRIASRLALPGSLPPQIRDTFRSPQSAPGLPYGRVEAYTYDSAGAEADQIAELLRAAHLRDGVAWDAMAVLVRSGRAMIPALSRALSAAGVPVEVAGDEIPLAIDPAVSPLLLGLQVAARGRSIDPDDAQVLLTSPLGGLDAMAVRRLGRGLRRAERAELAGTALPRPSGQLIAAALRHPELIADVIADEDRPELRGAAALAALLLRCERSIADGGTAEEALWVLWSGTRWPERLREQAAVGGESGRRANRDLDAICALFDIAHRSEEVSGLRGVTGFLAEVEGQQIPADTLGEADLRGSAVRLLTAHRAKGLEWDLVVVAGVQEGAWPDIRRRGSLLEPDRLGPHGLTEIEPTASRIAEERRLFYVACTRARRRLVVTAVAGTEGEGDQPSRFLTELGARVVPVAGRPRRPLTLAALVAELRRTCADPESPPALREEAAGRLARLADTVDEHGRPLVPMADPVRWWGMRELSDAAVAVSAPDEPIALSGSQLAGLLGCPRQWFLSRKGQADPARNTAATLRLGDPRAGRPRGAVRRAGRRAGLPPGAGLGSAELRRQLAVVGRAGRGRGGAGSVRHLAGGPTRDGAARHRGPVPGAGRPGVGPGAADRQRRPGGARSAGPDPDRRLQDLPGGPAVRRRRRAGPDGGLPARGAGRRLRRAGRSGRPTGRGGAGLPAAAGRPVGWRWAAAQVVPPGLAGRRAVPDRRSRRRTRPQ